MISGQFKDFIKNYKVVKRVDFLQTNYCKKSID